MGRSTAASPTSSYPRKRLRRLGGKSFYRAHEVIDSARIHDFGYTYTDDGITLTALVDSADGYADDYSVTAHVDQGIGDLTASHCTCPAYGRFGAICKHVIALIMAYDEDPDAFEALDEDGGDPSPAARPRPRRSPRTSRRLQAFMREREQSRQSDVQSRQLTLLKEIDAMSSSGGSTGARQGGVVSRHLPIGSVVLRPELRRFGTSWAVRLRLTVPSRSVAYVVKGRGRVHRHGAAPGVPLLRPQARVRTHPRHPERALAHHPRRAGAGRAHPRIGDRRRAVLPPRCRGGYRAADR